MNVEARHRCALGTERLYKEHSEASLRAEEPTEEGDGAFT